MVLAQSPADDARITANDRPADRRLSNALHHSVQANPASEDATLDRMRDEPCYKIRTPFSHVILITSLRPRRCETQQLTAGGGSGGSYGGEAGLGEISAHLCVGPRTHQQTDCNRRLL